MTPEELQRIQELVEAARQYEGSDRTAYLDEVCADDPRVRDEVDSLLQYESRAADFMEVPETDGVAPIIDACHARNMVGKRIGHFELIDVLGYGGMGMVYRAKQEHPEREVALKVARGGSYLDGHRLRLFEREVCTLARLRHPGIAAIYEAGRTDDGQHFFAMELVQGTPLNEHIRHGPLSIRSRFALFLKICDAINYAHQRGVIHRDIKPSNILVDGDGHVKILDFGLAKITDSDVTVTTMATETGKIQGTLSYMSPEQARGSSDDIDLRSDVYSLGVVLYEMLTDQLPYDLTRTILPEAVRVICDDPPKRLSSVNRFLRGDIETIVLKALEKEPARRYQSASALADDIERYLEDQPIVARPPSTSYQFRKLVSRHKMPFALASLLILAVTAFAVVAAVQAARIANERDKALFAQEEAEAARSQEVAAREAAEQVSDFLVELFEVADPADVQGREITAREILEGAAARIREELSDQPLVQARLMDTMGTLYRGYGLGRPDEARELLETALAIRRRELGDDHLDVATTLIHLAIVLEQAGAAGDAEPLVREALDIRRRHLTGDHELIAEALNDLGNCRYYQGDAASATVFLRQALDMRRRIFGPEHEDVAGSLHNLGLAARELEDLETAESMLREALAMNRRLFGDLHRSVAGNLDTLAVVVFARGNPAESETLVRESLALKRRLLADDHPGIAHALYNLAFLVHHRGDLDEAESLYREALSIRRKTFGDRHPSVAKSLNALGQMLRDKGDHSAAELMLREALAIRRALGGNDGAGLPNSLHSLSDLLRRQGRCAEAEPLQREALQLYRKRLGHHRHTANALNSLALLLQNKGDYEEADVLYREALAMRRELFGDDHPRVADTLNNLGTLHWETGDMTTAESLYRQALEIRRTAPGDEHPDTLLALCRLAKTLLVQGRHAEAEPLAIECFERHATANGSTRVGTPEPVELLVQLYEAWGKPDQAAGYQAMLPDPCSSPVIDSVPTQNDKTTVEHRGD